MYNVSFVCIHTRTDYKQLQRDMGMLGGVVLAVYCLDRANGFTGVYKFSCVCANYTSVKLLKKKTSKLQNPIDFLPLLRLAVFIPILKTKNLNLTLFFYIH